MLALLKNLKNRLKPRCPGFVFYLLLVLFSAFGLEGHLVQGQSLQTQAAQIKEEALEGLKKREWKTAETKAYEASELFLGENMIPSYLECLLIALQAHVEQNEKEAAKRGYRKVSEMAEEHLGPASVIKVEALLRLADLYEPEGDEQNALDIHLNVMEAEKTLGKKHPLMQQNYRWLHSHYLKTGKNKEASSISRKLK
jgi:hypothetical protein